MLLLCVVGLLVSGTIAEITEPDWGFQSYLDEDYTLTCNGSTLMPNPMDAIRWQLPNGEILHSGQAGKYMLRPGGTVMNMQLTIMNVQESDKGVYICHVYEDHTFHDNGKRGQLLRGLNIGGHKYREAFDEYRNNLMVGGLAAVCLFVPLCTACFVYKFRYQSKEQKRSKHTQREEAFQRQSYLESVTNGPGSELSGKGGQDNVAYENEERNTKL